LAISVTHLSENLIITSWVNNYGIYIQILEIKYHFRVGNDVTQRN